MVIKLSDIGTSLSAPPFIDILGFKAMASWPGSDKACPQCKTVGHDSRTCPKCPSSSKRSSKKSSSAPPPPTPSSSLSAADSAPQGVPVIMQATTSDAVGVVAPTSDPNISTSSDMDIADEDMADLSTSASKSTSTVAPTPTPITATQSSSGPTRMHQKDLLYLSPNQ